MQRVRAGCALIVSASSGTCATVDTAVVEEGPFGVCNLQLLNTGPMRHGCGDLKSFCATQRISSILSLVPHGLIDLIAKTLRIFTRASFWLLVANRRGLQRYLIALQCRMERHRPRTDQ